MNIPILENSNKKTLVFLSWRDIKASKMGGAEIFTHEMLKRIDHEKYRIIHLSPSGENLATDETIDGIRYIREGGIISVVNFAEKFYKLNKNQIYFMVDQCNTHRFFTPLWVHKKQRMFFIHQLTKDIWFKNAKFPINILGYITEPIFLWLSRNDYTITVSDSTKKDLLKIGFNDEKTAILPEGITFDPWKSEEFLEKEKNPTFIYVGRFVNYKGIDDAVEALGIVKKEIKNAKLWVVGKKNESYIKEKLLPIMQRYGLSYGGPKEDKDVTIWGFVSDEEKLNLMSRSKALVFPSLREGWGLIITEAAVVGTPSIVYNSPGLIDAVNNGDAGYLCNINTPENIAEKMRDVVKNEKEYIEYSKKSYEFSKKLHWDNTAKAFSEFLNKIEGDFYGKR